jgi:predicted nucleic acid-binding protein
VIYIDSSVVLAKLFTEDRNAPDSFWLQDMVSSRLLEYDVWTRVHSRKLNDALGVRTRFLISHINFVEMTPAALSRALQPFPTGLRTLDTLHLASMEYLRSLGNAVTLASFDRRLVDAARTLQIAIYEV